MSSRLISDCHPIFQPLVRRLVSDWASSALDVVITCTWRSAQEQTELYAQGRTKPGRIVTNARAGQSAHNFAIRSSGLATPAALAIDVVPLRFGKPVWGLAGDGIDENPADDQVDDVELWQRVRKCAEDLGLVSASRWKAFREWPHIEHPKAREIMGA